MPVNEDCNPELLKSAFHALKKGIIITDDSKKICSVNPEFVNITGYQSEEVIGKSPSILSSGKHSPEFYKKMWQDIADKGSWSGEIWNKTKDGKSYIEWLTISRFQPSENSKHYYIGVFSDVTATKTHQKQLKKLAYFDPLTKLPNRPFLLKKLTQHIGKNTQASINFAIIIVDLDGFKQINDLHGHRHGDKIILETANRLKAITPKSGFISRFGGDAFAVILPNEHKHDQLERFAQTITKAIQKPYYTGSQIHFISASSGICFYPSDGRTSEELIRKADMAMHEAKNQGRNLHRFYDDVFHSQNNRISKNLQLIKDAIQSPHQNLQVHYQPVISFNKDSKSEVAYFECLIRLWNGDKLIFPDGFIALAEAHNLISALTHELIHKICQEIIELNFTQYKFSINLSPRQFEQDGVLDEILNIVSEYGLNIENFKFEVTETAITQNLDSMNDVLNQLRSYGIEVLLDDFGTGYASLSMLKNLPADILKVDKSFCSELDTNEDDQILVKTIISMADSMKLKCVCEGVETTEQLDWLKQHNIQYCQGYLFSKPKPLENFKNLSAYSQF